MKLSLQTSCTVSIQFHCSMFCVQYLLELMNNIYVFIENSCLYQFEFKHRPLVHTYIHFFHQAVKRLKSIRVYLKNVLSYFTILKFTDITVFNAVAFNYLSIIRIRTRWLCAYNQSRLVTSLYFIARYNRFWKYTYARNLNESYQILNLVQCYLI